jgi:hypothetical protein
MALFTGRTYMQQDDDTKRDEMGKSMYKIFNP